MHFVTATELRNKSAGLWKELADENEIVVTVNGRPTALLTSISENNFEQLICALRQARAQLAVAAIQQASIKQGTARLSKKQIEQEIKLNRQKLSFKEHLLGSPKVADFKIKRKRDTGRAVKL